MSSFSNESTVSTPFMLKKTEVLQLFGKLCEEEEDDKEEEGKGCLTLELQITHCLNSECIFLSSNELLQRDIYCLMQHHMLHVKGVTFYHLSHRK